MNGENPDIQMPNQPSMADLLMAPLKWIIDLLKTLVDYLPQGAKVIVFYLLTVYLLIATTVVILWILPSEEIEIHGSVRAPNGNYFPESVIDVDLNGIDLYVTKVSEADSFHYEWIWRVPKSRIDKIRKFTFSKYDPDARRIMTLSSITMTPKKYKSSKEVLIEMANDFRVPQISASFSLFNRIFRELINFFSGLIDSNIFPASNLHSPSQKYFAWRELNIDIGAANPQRKPRIKEASFLSANNDSTRPEQEVYQRLSPEDVGDLLDNYMMAKHPIIQIEIREQLAQADSLTALLLADSLVEALMLGRSADISDYALILTDSKFLGMFASGGRYHDTFNDSLYKIIVNRLHTGNQFERNNLTLFLRQLQDERTVPYLLEDFSHLGHENAKRSSLIVLESFSTHPSDSLRQVIEVRLKSEQTKNHSDSLRQEIVHVIELFSRGDD